MLPDGDPDALALFINWGKEINKYLQGLEKGGHGRAAFGGAGRG
jgi:hypothetical protein